MLSILIPTYNTDCLSLIQALYRQCEDLRGKDSSFLYEMIVVDDCSPRKEIVSILQKGVRELGTESVRLYVLSHNLRHAAVRNFLLKEAKGEWILFVDSDAEVMSPLFIDSYWNHRFKSDIIIGGIAHPTQTPRGHELRLVYERKYAYKRDVTWRRMHPYAIFSVFNIFARASVIRNYGFDESCREYGYEDYLLGVALEQDGIAILHIDNPLMHLGIDTSEDFLKKTETAMITLSGLPMKMRDKITLVSYANTLNRLRLGGLLVWLIKPFEQILRKNLLSAHPSMYLFQLYKLYFYLKRVILKE